MIDELRKELALYAQQAARLKKVGMMLDSLSSEEAELERSRAALEKELSRQEADVARLEKGGAAALFYSALGKKEDRLDKERREAVAARLKHDAAAAQLESCRARAASLRAEQAELADSPEKYRRAYDRAMTLMRTDMRSAREFCELERRLGEARSQLREADEALAAGRDCLEEIGCMRDCLDKAEGWGTFDLIGGGMISALAKHDNLDQAQFRAQSLQSRLSRFRSELADVRVDGRMSAVNIDGFLRFADYFFDGIVADWLVLSRIHESQKSVEQTARQVSAAMSALEQVRAAREREAEEAQAAMDALVRG